MKGSTQIPSDPGQRVRVEDLLPLIEEAHRSPDPFVSADLDRINYLAAATLGSLPKNQPKRWTGWVGATHYWRGRKVILPCGQIAAVYGVLRGTALVQWDDPKWLEGIRREVWPVDSLRVYKHPAAVWMGKLKGGRRERPSDLKAQTARANGRRPCHPGKRRGRPRPELALGK